MAIITYQQLSNYVLAYCANEHIAVSNKKLQKLTYYCQAWHLALLKTDLVADEFEAWVHGAVLRPLYHTYSIYRYDPIPVEKQEIDKILSEFVEITNEDTFKVLQRVLYKYCRFSADELEDKNHKEWPWIEARVGLSSADPSTKRISKQLMSEYYASKALMEEMKTVKNNIYKFTPVGLKQAQDRLKQRELFKQTEDNAEKYKNFILDSYCEGKTLIERAEYGRKI
jgi:uncharacterized phage-associated protein